MHLSATPRWSNSILKTPWREDFEQLRYAPQHWSYTGSYGIGQFCISPSHFSTELRRLEQAERETAHRIAETPVQSQTQRQQNVNIGHLSELIKHQNSHKIGVDSMLSL
ncbi:hypothetical protein TNCV_745051 [Trichonephila clavipes]|nr:hypothetical protein TNCV_745051 [Trichonephila clavipes]